MSTIALIMAAGRGSRMLADYDVPKQYLPLGNKSILRRSIEVFLNHKLVDNVIVVIHPNDIELYKESTIGLDILDPVIGGERRQDSVRFGLEALSNINPRNVLIHDAARPFVDKKIITGVIEELNYSRSVLPAVPIEDTVKKCEDGKILWTIDRSDLWRAQTPQGFIFQDILNAHIENKDVTFTDDAALMEHINIPVSIVTGSQNNFKITTDSDYERAEMMMSKEENNTKTETKIGIGYDIHRFSDVEENCEIKLGCSLIPYSKKIIAHSDGDVVVHAIVDAILGSIGENDIGFHFSDKDEKWKNADSSHFLKKAMLMLKMKGGKIGNIDVNIITESPKISTYRDEIVKNLANVMEIDAKKINIKGKTKEKLDSVGQGDAIEVQVVCLVNLVISDE